MQMRRGPHGAMRSIEQGGRWPQWGGGAPAAEAARRRDCESPDEESSTSPDARMHGREQLLDIEWFAQLCTHYGWVRALNFPC